MGAIEHGLPLSVPSNLRLRLPISDALQTDGLAQHSRVLNTRYAQHWWNCRNIRGADVYLQISTFGGIELLHNVILISEIKNLQHLAGLILSGPQLHQLHSSPGTDRPPHHQVSHGRTSELHSGAQPAGDLRTVTPKSVSHVRSVQ